MTIAPTSEHASREAAGRVFTGYAIPATWYVGAGGGVAGKGNAMVRSPTLAHVAATGAN